MKYLFFIILLVGVPLVSQSFLSEKEFQMMKETDPNYKLERQKWIDDMHRAAPGFDYNKHNNLIRDIKRTQKNEVINQLIKKNLPLPQYDSIADGSLIGRWIERGSNNLAGRMLTCDIDWDTETIYIASAGGNIWKGTLNGENWTCLNNNYKLSGIVLLKVLKFGETNRIFVIAGTRAYYSDNEGLTWKKSTGLEKPQNWGGVKEALMTSDTVFYFLGNEWDYSISKSVACLYKSEDKGMSFTPVYKSTLDKNKCDLWTAKYDDNNVYFVHNDTLSQVLPDATLNMIGLINIDLSNIKQIRLAGNYSENVTTLYLYHLNKSNQAQFYKSTNEGNNWEQMGTVEYGPFSNNSFEVSSVYPEALYYGGVECSRSHDFGNTWTKVNSWGQYYSDIENKLHADIPAITSFKNPDGEEIVIISTDGGAYISYDYLNSVKNISLHGLNVSQYYSTYTYRSEPDKIFVGSQDQGFQRTTAVLEDGTHSFEQTISGDYGHLTSSDGGITLWCVYPGFTMLYKYLANPASTMRTSLDFNKTGSGGLWMRPILADPDDPNVAYLAGGGNDGYHHIWKITFAGGKLNPEQLPYRFSNKNVVSALGISNINTDLFYAMTKDGEFYWSDDKGVSFTKSENFEKLGGHYFYGASIAPSNVDEKTVYIAGSGYNNPAVYVSYDNGQNFTPLDSGLPNTLVYRIALSNDDKYIFAATAVGPYVYIQDKKMWFDMSDIHSPDQTYWSVEYIPSIKTARFATYGRGIWDFQIGEISSVNKKDFVRIDLYPNPTDDIVNLNILSPYSSKCTISINDELGRNIYEYSDYFNKYLNLTISKKDFRFKVSNQILFVKIHINDKIYLKKLMIR